MKRFWPVPNSYTKRVPRSGLRAFGAKRENSLRHSGVDIYAPNGSAVVAIEDGVVVKTGQFTGAPESPQWLKTYFMMIQSANGKLIVYGETRKPKLRPRKRVQAGQIVGHIARVRGIDVTGKGSNMLHLEVYKHGQRLPTDWRGKKPSRLLNASIILQSTRER